jgi:hypothetical protein
MDNKNFNKILFLLQFLLIAGCKSESVIELLGKTREEVLTYLSHSHYKFKDTIYTDPSLFIKEHIDVSKADKWNSEIDENITLDSSNRVVLFIDNFDHIPTEENKVMGMKKEDRDKVLADIIKKHGMPEVIKKDFNVLYHWEDSLNYYEFFGLKALNNGYYGYFTGETKKYRAYMLSIPLKTLFSNFLAKYPNSDSLLKSLPDSLLHRLDSSRRKILLSPFVK